MDFRFPHHFETPPWNINNEPSPLLQSDFRYVSTSQLSHVPPHEKKNLLAHRARIFITRISFRGPGACLAIHPSEAVERISKSLSEGFVAVAGGQSSSIPRLIWIFPDRMCTACISIPGDTPTNYGRARWPPLEARGTNEEGNGIRGW